MKNLKAWTARRPFLTGIVAMMIATAATMISRHLNFAALAGAIGIAALLVGVCAIWMSFTGRSDAEFNRSYDSHRECWVTNVPEHVEWVESFAFGYTIAFILIVAPLTLALY